MHLDDPLSDLEFEELDNFLLSDRCAENSMTMDTLHGYLSALVIGPEQIPQEEWLPYVWDPSLKHAPQFTSPQEYKKIVHLIERYQNEIALTLSIAPQEYEPLFCEHLYKGQVLLDGEAWAWGFWEAVNLRSQAWEPLWSSHLATLARPIYLLGAEELEQAEMRLRETPLQRHQLTVAMEEAIPKIYRYWRSAHPQQPHEDNTKSKK